MATSNLTSNNDMDRTEAEDYVRKINLGVNQAGIWLIQFRDRKGWKALGYSSFKECCGKEFAEIHGGRSNVYALMQQAEVSKILDTPVPITHSRELAKLPAAEQKPAYQEAVETSGGKPTVETVKKVVEKRQAAAPPKPKKPAKPQVNEKYLVALERIEAVLGKSISKAVKDGSLSNVTEKAAIFWAELKDEPMEAIRELVVSKRWDPRKAHAFLEKVPDEKTKIGDLQNLALSAGGATLVVTGSFATICVAYRKLPDEYAKIKKLLGLDK